MPHTGVQMVGALSLLLVVGGCRGERTALADYLNDDLPTLTRGAGAVVAAFTEVMASSTQDDVAQAQALQERVISPYATIVERLGKYEPGHATVRRHHSAYLSAAIRQQEAFVAAREALLGRGSLDEAAGMLRVSRADMNRWLVDVRASGERLGIELRSE